MLAREVVGRALQPLGQLARMPRAELAVHQRQELALAVEAAGEKVSHHALAEEGHYGALRAPAQRLRDLELVAVVGAQLDHAQPVKLRKRRDSLGLGDAVARQHVFQCPVAEAADCHQQQLGVGHDGALLLQAQHAQCWRLG